MIIDSEIVYLEMLAVSDGHKLVLRNIVLLFSFCQILSWLVPVLKAQGKCAPMNTHRFLAS